MTPTLQHTAPGPARFRAPVPERREPVWRSLASALALALVIVGLPCLMLWQAGPPPVPSHLDVSLLMRAVTIETVLGVLNWVVWLAWLQFTVCTVVEFSSALRGSGLPAHVPLAGGTQTLVRRLVTSVLVMGAVAAPAAAAPATAPEPAPAVAIQAQAPADAAATAADRGTADGRGGADQNTDQEVRYMLGDTELPADVGAELVGQRVYVVQPPAGRYHDNMWDIAERTLGDGRAYQQIYDLNVGRTQPDGRTLELARLIHPGWYLIVPESAQDVDRVVAVPVEDTTPSDAAAGSGAAAGASGASTAPDTAVVSIPDVPPAQMPALGALLAASLTAILAERRRRAITAFPGKDARELERLLRVGADPQRSDRLLRILRSLETLPGQPAPYAVVIDDAACRLLLPNPLPQAPHPWTTNDGGMTWSLPAGAEPETPVADSAVTAAAGLVTVGRDENGADILIDLGSADGDVVVGGEPTMAAELITALALELCTNPWSAEASVFALGLPTALQRIVGDRLHMVQRLDDVLPSPTGTAAHVITGRHRRRERPFVLTTGQDAPPQDSRDFSLIRTGQSRGARWRIELDASGVARIDPLGVTVTATRATEFELEGLDGLLAPAAPAPPGTDTRPPVPDPPQPPLSTAALRAAAIRILVLGPATVDTSAAIAPAPERLDLLTEAAVCLALHPEGVRPDVLGAMLWPLGVTGDVVAATVERLRDWLGTDSQGVPHVRQDEQGRLLLGPDVICDWDVLRSLLSTSRSSDIRHEAELLLEALRLVRGAVGESAPAGRYSWLTRVRTTHQADALITDAAHRLAQILHDTDPDGAALAVDIGLRVVDLDQRLWRDRLRLAAARGRNELLAHVDALLDAAGADDVAHVDPATAALVEELAPGASVRRAPA